VATGQLPKKAKLVWEDETSAREQDLEGDEAL
jgi:hypothetical protein